MDGARRAPLLMAEHSLLQPLPPRSVPGAAHAKSESRPPARQDSRKSERPPRAPKPSLGQTRSEVNRTSSRRSGGDPGSRTRESSDWWSHSVVRVKDGDVDGHSVAAAEASGQQVACAPSHQGRLGEVAELGGCLLYTSPSPRD